MTSLPACAQRAGENVIAQAKDAFGITIGNEEIGLYSENQVRGFSPIDAGNTRLEGLYFDRQAPITGRLIAGATIRVGLTAQTYPFSAPTGLVDYDLRPAGRTPVRSLLATVGPNRGRELDLDVQQPLSSTLSVAAGVSYRVDDNTPGATVGYFSRALIADWQGPGTLRLTAFWGRYDISDDHAVPFIVPDTVLPPHFHRHYFGQDWTTGSGFSQLYGVIARGKLPGDIDVRGGVFESDYIDSVDFADLYTAVQPNGTSAHTIIADPPQTFRSLSGEIRLAKSFTGLGGEHKVLAMVRGRRLVSAFGGTDVLNEPVAQVGADQPLRRPDFVFHQRSTEEVSQQVFGLGYEGNWRNLNTTLSLQHVAYDQRLHDPSGVVGETRASPWLFGATAAYQFLGRGLVYAGYTSGLENSGTVPDNARNFPGALPASQTWQRDAGLRWALSDGLQALIGVFEIHKPYFNLDANNDFVKLGQLSNRGVELSLAGHPMADLTVIAGAIFSDPTVGAQFGAPRIGRTPVAVPGRTVSLYLEKAVPGWPLAFDVGINYLGKEELNTTNTLAVHGFATVDAGVRWKLHLRGAPTTLRLQLLNLTNAYGWIVFPGGAIQPLDPRRATLTLTTDF